MKTLLKNIEIEFTISFKNQDNFTLKLSNGSNGSFDSTKILAKGILIGQLDKILTTKVIFYN